MILLGLIILLLFLVVCGLKIAWLAFRLVIGLLLLAHSLLNQWLLGPEQQEENVIYMIPPRRPRMTIANEN